LETASGQSNLLRMKRRRKYEPGGHVLHVRKSSAGKGLFAGEAIAKGTCIIEYVGRVLTAEEEYASRSKYLFEVTARKTIDGRPKWNKAGYINHSCRGNAEPVVHKGRVFIMARRNIKPGEEIAYDYGRSYFDSHIRPNGCRCSHCKTSR
jgi:SET domain-containing protein